MNRFLAPLGFLVAAVSLIILNTVSAVDNPFKLTNAEITDRTSGVDASITGFTDTNIATDVTFYHLNDSVTYSVTLANTSENNLTISSISDNNTNPYITYLYDSNANTKILAGETLELEVVAKYSTAIPDVTARTQNLNVKFIVDYEIEEDITVPDTNTTEPTDSTETSTDTTSVPDTGANTHSAVKRTKSVDPVLIGFIILGAILLLIGLARSKTSIGTKVLVFAILGSLGVTATIKATSEQLTFEFDSSINIKSLLSVTYNVDGEEHNIEIPYGGTLPLEDQEKEGYHFDGWQDEDSNTIDNTTPITDDINISATWTVISYTISYSYEPNLANLQPTMACNGATLDLRTNYTIEDADITIPMLVNFEENNANTCQIMDGRAGYRFLGWKENGEGEIIENPVIAHGSTGNKNYVGIFRQAHLTVYIDPDGGIETAPGPFTLAYQEHLDLSPYHFTKANYTQTGWNYAEDFVNDYSVVDDATVTIKPTWKHNDYTLHFNYGNSTCSRADEVHTFAESYNIPRYSGSSDPCVPRGYYFGGWTDVLANKDINPEGVTGPRLTINENDQAYLKAEWLPNAYMLYLNANGSSYSPASFKESYICDDTNGDRSSCRKDLYYDTEIALPTAAEMTREGYTFNGWNDDASNIHYVPGATVKSLSDDGTTINMTADWSANLNTASFYSADGNTLLTTCEMYTDETLKTVLAKDGCNPISRPGYYVERWTDTPNGTDHISTNSFRTHSDVSFYVHTERPNKFNVIFHPNYTDADPTEQSIQVTYDSNTMIQGNIFTRMGYKIDSYNTLANGEGNSYNVGANIGTLTTERNATVDLYAQWSLNTYTIVFHANDDDATGEMNNLEALHNTPVSLTKNTYKKPGYVFTQWNTQADGSGIGFDDEATVLNMASEGTIDLYAQWRLAVAQFKRGLFFNNQVRYLSGAPMPYGASLGNTTPMINNTGYLSNSKVLAIKQSPVEPDFDHMNTWYRLSEDDENYDPEFEKANEWNIVSTPESLDPIYIWYVPNDEANTNGIIYYWSNDIDPQLNQNSARMFEAMPELADIDYLQFDTTDVEAIDNMFMSTKIATADLSGFDTTKLKSMRQLFNNCSSLTSVTFGDDFDTSRVQDFTGIFRNNKLLESIDISMFDTRIATSLASLFAGAEKLTTISYGEDFKTDMVKNFSSMYEGTLALKDLDIIKTFNTSAGTNMDSMFKNNKISEIDVSNFDTANVTDMGSMFMNMDGLSTLDISNFDTRKVQDMSYLFRGLKNITAHPIVGENFKTGEVTDMYGMYRDYSNNLVSIDLSEYDTSKVQNISELFMENPQLVSLNLAGIVTNEVTNFAHMFDGCMGLRVIPETSTFNTEKATNMSYMFASMNLDSLDITSFNGEKVQTIAHMFSSTSVGQDLDFSNFHTTTALTDVDTAFANFSTPFKLDLSTFNTEKVTIFQYMFKGCTIPYLDISSFNLSSSKNMQQMFNVANIETLDIGKFETNGAIINGNYFMSYLTAKTILVSPDYEPNFGNILDISNVVGGQGTTYLGPSGTYGRIDHAEDGGEPGYFTDRSKYTVKYYINTDDTNVSGSMDDQVMVGGETTTLNANQFTRTGYKFGGWNTKADLTGTHYDDEQSISGYGTLHLYAEWGLTPYTVIFDKNAEDATGTMENLTKAFGEWFNLPANNYAKTHYKFMGWNTKADGTGKHYDNEELVVNLDIDGEVTLYAEWLESTAIIADHGPNTGFGLNVKSLVGNNGSTPSHANYTVKKIVRSDAEPTDEQKARPRSNVAAANSNFPVYIWFDEPTGTIYWWSEAETVFMAKRADYMFANFKALESVDIEDFDTSLTTSMAGLFNGDEALASIDLSNFDTDGVTDIHQMFRGCAALDTLDVSGFDTDDVTNMSDMFSGLTNVSSLNVTGFNTENVENFSGMFRGMKNLTNLDVSGFNTGKATLMNEMFRDCEKLETINVSGFNTAKVTSFEGMFRGCKAVEELDVSGFVTSSAWNISGMFYGCSSIMELNLHNFNTSNVISMNHTFLGLTNVEVLDLSTFDTKNVTGMQYTFSSDINLKTIYVTDKFVTSAIPENSASSQLMFYQCGKLVGGLGTRFSGQFINHARAHIDGGPDNPGYFTDKNRIIITYHKNDDRATGEMPVQNQAAGTITLNTNQFFRGEGYSFGGWNTQPDGSGEHYDNGQTIVDAFGSLNLYAEWGISPYTITFDKNDEAATGATEPMTLNYGERANLNLSGFTKEHYAQIGWNTKADGSGKHYEDGESVVNVINDGEITLYAEWVEAIATLMPGKEINGAMKRVSNAGSNYEHPNRIIRKFERSDTMPTNVTGLNIAMSDSNLPVYIWFDGHDNVNTVYYYSRAEKIYLNEDISYMFSNFARLESADLTQFEAPRITAMENLFNQCASLTSFDISNIDTSEVTDMTGMFSFTRSLQTIELPTFNTENVTNMSWMFSKTGATTIDISTFDTGNVTNMSNMLRSYEPGENGITPSVHTIYVGDKFTTANVASSAYIFRTQSILVGGAGTASATSGNGDKFIFARIDDPDNGKPGYLSMKGARYVRYNKNGADGTEEMASHYLTNSGSLKTNIFTNTGKTFAGWNTAADGSGDEYTDGQLMSDLVESKEPLTLYAQWLGEGFNGTVDLTPQYSTANVLQKSSTMSQGYVGAAYFDPSDLSKRCNANSANVANKEAKTGCMKWYIYDDSGDSYKMILDHNTTKTIAFNSDNKNSNPQALYDCLDADTADWDKTKLSTGILTAADVAAISSINSFNPANSTYYSLGTEVNSSDGKGRSAYGWLYDYTRECEIHGCDHEVSTGYGHWTTTPVSGNTKNVWLINYFGRLTFTEAKLGNWGIRPIVTVSKTDVTAE